MVRLQYCPVGEHWTFLEADLASFEDDDNAKSDSVDAHIGEESRFHDTVGYYGKGVSTSDRWSTPADRRRPRHRTRARS